jgi:hypothetical protein
MPNDREPSLNQVPIDDLHPRATWLLEGANQWKLIPELISEAADNSENSPMGYFSDFPNENPVPTGSSEAQLELFSGLELAIVNASHHFLTRLKLSATVRTVPLTRVIKHE